jgi:Fe-S oxidoreductase
VRKSLRSRVFANIHYLSRAGCRFAPVSNWVMGMPGTQRVNHHLLGIHKDRIPPSYAVPSFPTWFRRHDAFGRDLGPEAGARGEVLLFHDTFMDFHYPEIGIAATRLMERAGYRVRLAETVCCGRPMISKGFHDQALEHVRENVNRLHGPASEGRWIVGCEPSCLFSLRDSCMDLAPPGELREKAETVARQVLLIDEFLERILSEEEANGPSGATESGKAGLCFQLPEDGPKTLLFHSHCHHKAMGRPDASRRLLERAGYTVHPVAANCCGMAGSFGAEREHYDQSRKTFDEGVGLALQNDPEAAIAVTGVSCRMQISDLAGRKPRHVVEWLSDALAAPGDVDCDSPAVPNGKAKSHRRRML